MKRRVALKSLAVVVAGVVFLPACDTSNRASSEAVQSFLSPRQNQLLANIVDAIIPATETPGAKALGVHDYVKVMVADCHEPEVHKIFLKGLDTLENVAQSSFGESFQALGQGPQMVLLKKLAESDDESNKQFFALIKGLAIQGYMSSEYIMTNHLGYKMVPGPHYACIPVSSKPKA